MPDNSDKVMVALLPIISDWAQIENPHLTLAYAGRTSEIAPSSLDALGKAAMSIGLLCSPVTLRVLTMDVFGEGTDDNPKVDVVRFHPNLDLLKMRAIVQDWDTSKFPFNPHLTVGPEGTWNKVSPVMVAFDRVALVVGDNSQEFRMSYNRGGGYE